MMTPLRREPARHPTDRSPESDTPQPAMPPAAQPASPSEGSVLGFDFGEKRIGVALGEHLMGIAHPLTTIDTEVNDERFRRIGDLIAEWKPVALVVGLPLSLDGEEHQMTQLCRRFARRLEGRRSSTRASAAASKNR
jgi:hypothetical protein